MVVRQRSTILRQALILISQPSNALTAMRLIPPVWISHNFKAMILGLVKKKMRNQGFEPWTFKSCLGYQHFVVNDNNHDQRKKDSKKTSTATIAEIKTEANVAEKVFALVAATDHGDRFQPLDLLHKKLFPQPMDIQTRQTIGCGIKQGKLYYLDLQSKDSNKLQQALMADESEGEKKKSEIWLWHRHLGHASFAKTPISYWGEAITSAAYLINRVPSSSINFQTPLQALTNVVVAPTVPNLPSRVFGCVAFVHLHKHQRTKLTSHALQCVFVGYALHKKGYRCYHPPTRQMYITMDVVLQEDSMYFSSESELKGEYHKEIQTLNYDYHISEEDESGQFELVNQEVAIPNSVQETLADPRWKAAMNEEMKSLQKNETWELVECPPEKKSVGCRWIYTVKYKANGSIERFKARLVAKGYTQTYGIDYTETFAPVVKINTVREIGMSGCQPVNTPIEEGLKLCVEPNQVSTDKGRYQRLVGILIHAYLRYLKNALGKGILFAKNVDHQNIEVYTDADWAMQWMIGDLHLDLGYLFRQPIRLFCDNKAACDIAHNSVQHDCTKHVEVDRFFIKEKLDDKIVELPKIRSGDQLADILTKDVSSQVFSKFLDKLGMCDIYAPT
ncbi:Retrovirus-related Pol polyprotein from transposon TNT 1-94 [Vitis vinifera]|uniref:Retrovirus-related Pol polyprotein from transposon TNT 1-94 n=1 Tax=Vitis vinifera TaxID=29760 RepID=A0A438IPU9_VITVI|nr:Retrovirus-related Pol polyprotein from transposon TNT 1-94 [Vitis vinifera]